jgi:hypothetical protein
LDFERMNGASEWMCFLFFNVAFSSSFDACFQPATFPSAATQKVNGPAGGIGWADLGHRQ